MLEEPWTDISMDFILGKSRSRWEKCLPHIEFAYNMIVHATSLFSHFEDVYVFNPLTPMDILPLPTNKHFNLDGKEKADLIKEIHARVRANIEKENVQYAKKANIRRLKVVFQSRDWV